MSGDRPTDRLLACVIALRRLELAGGDRAIGDVRSELEALIRPTVSRAVAARALGISQTALDRHARAGSIAVVPTPDGRREVPIGEIVGLAVERFAHLDARHPLASVLAAREDRARSLVKAQRLPRLVRPAGHRAADVRSLAYHQLVADRLDSQLVADARRRLQRWRASAAIDPHHASRWDAVLDRPIEVIRERIVADDEAGRELRQSSPFAGSLNGIERRALLAVLDAR